MIEFLSAKGVCPIEIHSQMQVVYGDDCVGMSIVCHWAKKCNDGQLRRVDLRDKQQSRHSVTATNEFHKKNADKLIKDNCRTTWSNISIKLGISEEHLGHVIEVLQYRKVCEQWAPYMLTEVMKALRVNTCQELPSCYENKHEEFLHSIVTADKTWVHQYEPETKCQSTGLGQKNSWLVFSGCR
jgi:hypothetical protein